MDNTTNDYRNQTHYQPIQGYHNVKCLNGSAHISKTTDITKVTCPLCLTVNLNSEFWEQKRIEKNIW
jgi:hypothetical protein